MTTLTYDGSLSGFLCLAATALAERLAVCAIQRDDDPHSGHLFAAGRRIERDSDRAAAFADRLRRQLGRRFLVLLGQALLSEEPGIDLLLYELTRRALQRGPACLDALADPLVNRVDKAARRTARERHRLLGLLRFSRLADDSYLARCRPQANVVPLLGGHFARRLGDQHWLIVDDTRGCGAWGRDGRWQLVEQVALADGLAWHADERQVADLWRRFYHGISNPQRHNPGLRRQFMPQRYWRDLTELQQPCSGVLDNGAPGEDADGTDSPPAGKSPCRRSTSAFRTAADKI